jgi:hypothetical protein
MRLLKSKHLVDRQKVRKPQTSPEWMRWLIEVEELVEQRDNLRDHPHSLGEAWETNLMAYYQGQIDDLRAHEPVKLTDMG